MHLFAIEIAGIDQTIEISRRLVSLSMMDKRGLESDELTLTLDDTDGRMPLPTEGNAIQLWLGMPYSGELVYKGEFTIDEAEHSGTPDQIQIRAKAADMKSTLKAKRSESYHDITLNDIAGKVAARHSLTLSIDDTAAAITFEHVDQTRESDLNLLTRLAKQNDLSVSIKNAHLIIKPTANGKTASGQDLGEISITRASGDSHRYRRADRTSDYDETIASYRDRKSAKIKHIKVDASGTVSEVDTLPEDKSSVITKVAKNKSEATKAAKAKAKQQDRQVAEFELQFAVGRPDIIAEATVKVSGFRDYIDAHDWMVMEVSHDLSGSGYQSRVKCEAGIAES